MRNLGTKLKKVKFADKSEAILLELAGYIDASTFIKFERTLKGLVAKKVTRLAVDMYEVEYINSTGMGMLLAVAEALKKAGGSLVLLRVPKLVGQTMHMLGLSALIPFLAGKKEMAQHFAGAAWAAPAAAPRPKKAILVERPAQALAARSTGAGLKRPVLLVAPAANLFTDLVRLRLAKNANGFHIVNDCVEAWTKFPQINPDLVILEDSLIGSDELLGKIKTDKDRCNVSVLKLYPKKADPRTKAAFKIWENDYLIEPFEIRELFALAEAELMRVPRDRKNVLQLVHFTFQYSEDNLNRALSIGKNAIFHIALPEDKAVPLYAAFQEAIDNALRHGNRYDARKRVDVTLLVTQAEIQITVEDEGRGFDFSKYVKLATELDAVARTRLAREEGKIGGLGIKLMSECADRLEYFEKGRRIRLTKKIGAAAAAPAKPSPARKA